MDIRQGVESFLGLNEHNQFIILFVVNNDESQKIYKAELPFGLNYIQSYQLTKLFAEVIKWKVANFVECSKKYPSYVQCERSDILISEEDINRYISLTDPFFRESLLCVYSKPSSGLFATNDEIIEYADRLLKENGKIVAQVVDFLPVWGANFNNITAMRFLRI